MRKDLPVIMNEKRARPVNDYTGALISYLEGNLSKKKLREKVEAVLWHGRCIGPVDFTTDFDKNLRSLKRGGKVAWGKLLLFYQNDYCRWHLFALSPWYKTETVVLIDYGLGFIHNHEIFSRDRFEITTSEAEELIVAKDWFIRNCDKYLVAVSKTESKVYWLGNTIAFYCSDGAYYPLKRPRKRKDWAGWGTVEQRDRHCK